MSEAEEIARLREKNRELNRRCQQADAAAADAKRCLDELARGTEKGTPWCGGSFGRALLAWHVQKQDAEIERLMSLVLSAREIINVISTEDGDDIDAFEWIKSCDSAPIRPQC